MPFQGMVIESTEWSQWRRGGASELGLGDKTDTCDGFYRDDVTWLEMGRLVKYESSDSISNTWGAMASYWRQEKKCRRSYVCREKAQY